MTHALRVFRNSVIFSIFAVFFNLLQETSQGLTPLGHPQIYIRLPALSGYTLCCGLPQLLTDIPDGAKRSAI